MSYRYNGLTSRPNVNPLHAGYARTWGTAMLISAVADGLSLLLLTAACSNSIEFVACVINYIHIYDGKWLLIHA